MREYFFRSIKCILILVFIHCSIFGNAEINYGKSFFRTDTIHEIRLFFKQTGYWDTLVSRYEEFHDFDSIDFTLIADVSIDGLIIDSIGVKLKSNFSYSIPGNKKPIKIDFNSFVKGKTFDGLRALNLSNEFPDPSMLRNTVAFQILRDAGLKAPRTSFARVYLNNVYKGLYVVIEQIDKSFLSMNFSDSGGDLIKPIASSLSWLEGDTISFFRNYEIKSKSDSLVWSRLIAFAKKINTTRSEIFYDSLSNIFNFDSYIPVFAADIIFNNWDSYFFGQNYYLYRDTIDNKFHFLPWDYNVSLNNYETSGGDFDLFPGGKNSGFFKLPLPDKIINNKILREKYLNELCRINLIMQKDSLREKIITLHEMLKPSMLKDPGKAMTPDQYNKSLYSRIGISEIEFEGLLTFIRNRSIQINKLLKIEGIICSDK